MFLHIDYALRGLGEGVLARIRISILIRLSTPRKLRVIAMLGFAIAHSLHALRRGGPLERCAACLAAILSSVISGFLVEDLEEVSFPSLSS